MSVAGVGVPAFRMFDGDGVFVKANGGLLTLICLGGLVQRIRMPCNVAQRVGGNVGECRRRQERRSSSNNFVAVPTASSVLEPPGSINSRTMLSPVVLLLRRRLAKKVAYVMVRLFRDMCHGVAQKNVA